ncbi:MAG: hypothetical protein LBB14_01965 [Puniceicoccales bacterium]|nr:hypothetical protein [Puniceicoccales bacterium]
MIAGSSVGSAVIPFASDRSGADSVDRVVSDSALLASILPYANLDSQHCAVPLDGWQKSAIGAAPAIWRAASVVCIIFLPIVFLGGIAISIVQLFRRSKDANKIDFEGTVTRRALLCPFAFLLVPFIGVVFPTTSLRFLCNSTPFLVVDVDRLRDVPKLNRALGTYGTVRGFFFLRDREGSEIDAFMGRHLPAIITCGRDAGAFLPFLANSLGLGDEARATAVLDRAYDILGAGHGGTREEFLRQCAENQSSGAELGEVLVDFLRTDGRKCEAAGQVNPGLIGAFEAVMEDIFSRKELAELVAEKFAVDCARIAAPSIRRDLESSRSALFGAFPVPIEIPGEDSIARVLADAVGENSSLKTLPPRVVKAFLECNGNLPPECQGEIQRLEVDLGQLIARRRTESSCFICVKALFDYLQLRAGNGSDS